jgi:hypothetical protein
MMRAFFFSTIVVFLSNGVLAQQINCGRLNLVVIDSIARAGINGATVSLAGTAFVTNGSGLLKFERSLPKGTRIKVSCVGYKDEILVTDGACNDTVKLSSLEIALREVSISGHKHQGLVVGDYKKRYNAHRVPNPDEIFAEFIPNVNKIKGTIEAIQYVLNDELKGIDKPFKVGLYTKYKNSIYPCQNLVNDSIIICNTKKTKILRVDISKYHIKFPEDGVIAIFQTLDSAIYNKDSIWYATKAFRAEWRYKMPCIDMDLIGNNDYSSDDKHNRTVPYAMVISGYSIGSSRAMTDNTYCFVEGTNLAITIIVDVADKQEE